jgi:hypothetical protein
MAWYDSFEVQCPDYDAWKLRSPDDELHRFSRYRDEESEPFVCSACEDEGLMLDDCDHVVPCCECSTTRTLEDIDDVAVFLFPW